MKTVTAHTDLPAIPEAVRALQDRLAPARPRLVLYFASPRYAPGPLAAAMEQAFAPAAVVGCTTAGEIASGGMLKGSVVAMALPAELVGDLAVELVPDLTRPAEGVEAAFQAFGRHFGTPMRDLDPARHIGLVLADGLSGAEEALMFALGNRTDVSFVGGSAGDDLAFQATHVFARGAAHRGAAALVLLRLDRPFRVLKTQSFRPLARKLVATRVRPAQREVVEFDGQPASEAYARALGVDRSALPDQFAAHPVGLMVGDEPYVRSPQQAVNGAVRFYCSIAEGTELTVLQATDIVEDTAGALKATAGELGKVAGIINFNCILRTLELERKGQTAAYGDLFAKVPTVGFSTYGEAYFGHINQTATMLVLGAG